MLHLPFFARDTGEQPLDAELTDAEKAFIRRVAFPQLDAVTDDRSLESMAAALWNLCLWERQRTTSLDTKAAALAGLSSLAAAVVSASTVSTIPPDQSVLLARCASIALFIITVLLSLNAQRVAKFGGFIDRDMFDALGASREPVGETPRFSDSDPHRCFLRELALQRWLVYRTHCDANDRKYKRLGVAQLGAAIAVASLIVSVLIVLL